MVNSIRKGKKFERECAKLLTEITGVKWQRVPCSGGMQTAQNIEDRRFRGDLFTEDEKYKDTVVECKITKKKITLAHLFNRRSEFWSWWMQLLEEAGKNKKLLIFRYGNSPVFLVSDDDNLHIGDTEKIGDIILHNLSSPIMMWMVGR